VHSNKVVEIPKKMMVVLHLAKRMYDTLSINVILSPAKRGEGSGLVLIRKTNQPDFSPPRKDGARNDKE
jgi:hypothetical protein